MGVPKFYRWLSERYPQINNLLSDRSILPEIDNLYLDMNGIIHACTHPNDNDMASGLTLREMMLAIFRYIDRMVTEIAKPKKILFMAIDGCAPRAKMNQQRSRRFRAAQDRLELMAQARERGETVDEENMFDSNCITPGTEFMEQVGKHLRWFIRKKMKEDPLWKDLEVTFSGHDVPGEGEHKIMQYIRELRARDDYQPNVRHCMYGQDADLIMLGLATHEPHFTLLREVVNFNSGFNRGASARTTVLRQTKEAQFQLLSLAMLREYIEVDLALGCSYAVDKERLCDDFIFLTFLVGNDFLPHLPTLDIGEHAFDLVFNSYKELLQESEGYLVHNGELGDLVRLEKLFQKIGKHEAEILATREYEESKFQAKRRKYKDANVLTEEELEEAEEERQRAYEEAIQEALGKAPAPSVESKQESLPSKDYRGRYYFEKFQVVSGTPKATQYLDTLMSKYLEGLMWCLAYYIKGCISWTWYYPYHYGPMLIDMRELQSMANAIKFDLGQPFRPFQQLLGCLPPASKKLLPRMYQWIMTSVDSPMIEFYPNDFKIDQDGKKNPWEAVVLLPFIDEKILIAAERDHCKDDQLSVAERGRNTFGKVLVHRFDPSVTDTFPSCNPEIGLSDIPKCQTRVVEEEPDYAPGVYFQPKLVPGTAACLAGFPSLGVLRIADVSTESYKINVFGSDSKYKTVAIELDYPEYDPDSIDIKSLLGRVVHVNYPQLHEAKVAAISNEREEFRLQPSKDPAFPNTVDTIHTKFHAIDAQKWKKEAAEEESKYLRGRGFAGTGGLAIGEIKIRLRVLALQGMKRDPVSGANKKVYGTEEADVPIQMALWSPPVVDERFLETDEMPVAALYPYGSQVIGVSGKFKGCVGTVVGPHTEEESRLRAGKTMTTAEKQQPRCVDVEFAIPPPEPPFGYMIEASIKEEYLPAYQMAKTLNISPSLLGKIVGSLIIDKIDVGLNLKRNGQYFLLSYVREVVPPGSSGAAWASSKDSVRVIGAAEAVEEVAASSSNTWEYSAKAVALILDFKTQFPLLFKTLEKAGHEKKYNSKQLFGPTGAALLAKVDEWLNNQFTAKAPRTPLSTVSLSKDAMKAIEKAADIRRAQLQTTPPEKVVVRKVPLDAIYRGDFVSQFDAPLLYNASQIPRLGDRVRNLNSLGVPFALQGTVLTIHNATGYVEVVFDEEFVGGKALAGSCSQFRGRLCPWHGLLRVSTDEQARAVGSTGLGASSSTRPQPMFNHGNAVKKAKNQSGGAKGPPKQVPGRDGHVLGMHPMPVAHIKPVDSKTKAPGSIQEISALSKGLVVGRADIPVSFATAPPPVIKFRPSEKIPATQDPVSVSSTQTSVTLTASSSLASEGKSILNLLQQQLNISTYAQSGTALPTGTEEVGKVAASMGGFRILRRTVESTTDAVAPPVPPTEPIKTSDGTGRAALAQAAGLDERALPPLPEVPVEHPLAGVIQINTAKPPMAPSVAGVTKVGNSFFSSAANMSKSDRDAQRPPSPQKRSASPQKPKSGSKTPSSDASTAAASATSQSGGSEMKRPAATATVAEKLAFAKAMMKQRKDGAPSTETVTAASPGVEIPIISSIALESTTAAVPVPVSLAELESFKAPEKEKKLVPLNLLLKKMGK